MAWLRVMAGQERDEVLHCDTVFNIHYLNGTSSLVSVFAQRLLEYLAPFDPRPYHFAVITPSQCLIDSRNGNHGRGCLSSRPEHWDWSAQGKPQSDG